MAAAEDRPGRRRVCRERPRTHPGLVPDPAAVLDGRQRRRAARGAARAGGGAGRRRARAGGRGVPPARARGRDPAPAGRSATTCVRSSTCSCRATSRASARRSTPSSSGDLYDTRFAPGLRELRIAEIDALALSTGVQRGEAELDDGERIRYLAAPGRDGRPRARRVRGGDRPRPASSARSTTRSGSRPVSASACCCWPRCSAWAVAGRVLAPLRAAARHRPLDRRDRSHPAHPGRGRRRAGRPRAHLQRDARPARGGVRQPEGVHQRRRPRAAHPDHDRPRPPRR